MRSGAARYRPGDFLRGQLAVLHQEHARIDERAPEKCDCRVPETMEIGDRCVERIRWRRLTRHVH